MTSGAVRNERNPYGGRMDRQPDAAVVDKIIEY